MYICYDSSLFTESYVKDCKGLPGIPILLFNEISTLKKTTSKSSHDTFEEIHLVSQSYAPSVRIKKDKMVVLS